MTDRPLAQERTEQAITSRPPDATELELARARRRIADLESSLSCCPCGGFCVRSRIAGIPEKNGMTHCSRCGAEKPADRAAIPNSLCVLCDMEMGW